MLTDAHLHIRSGSYLKIHPEISRVFLNATSESDFETVRSAASEKVAAFFGFHPWETEAPPDFMRLEYEIKSNPGSGIGECGLDFSNKYRHSREKQVVTFERHLELAFEFRRSLSIHCVQAWGQLFDSLRRFLPLPEPFILHSFYGSSETAGMIIRSGGYLSLSKTSIRNPEKSYRVIAELPTERILIESDSFSGGEGFSTEDHFNLLLDNYRRLASIRNIPVDRLADEVNENGKIFKN